MTQADDTLRFAIVWDGAGDVSLYPETASTKAWVVGHDAEAFGTFEGVAAKLVGCAVGPKELRTLAAETADAFRRTFEGHTFTVRAVQRTTVAVVTREELVDL